MQLKDNGCIMSATIIQTGACKQAERKVLPSTLEPDLDNANVGKERYLWEIPNEVFPFFICIKIDIHHGSSFQVFA